MQSRWQRLLLVVLVLVGAAMGVAEQALAQTITEFPIPTAGSIPAGITAGPDGALWFTETDGNKIGRITTAGAVTEFPLPEANSYPFCITAGPDGALWFTEQLTYRIGRITTAGAITEFPLPNIRPTDIGNDCITTGPDGALWLTGQYGNMILRITTTGGLTGFALPIPNSAPVGITSGPDGALWFTEVYANQIGRITTAGVITEFPIPTPGNGALGITAGPDGALWFTEIGSGQIGRITTAGVITEFPGGSEPNAGITTGPDGALWFTDFIGLVGRTTAAGVTTEFTIPTSQSRPQHITMGPDGALWFTEEGGNKIGRVSVPLLQVSPASNIATSGFQGGPFGPPSFQYQLSASTGSVDFSISGVPSWLTASVSSGTASTTPLTVTFTVNETANTLTPGTYGPITITFTNTDSGQNTTTVTAALTVNPPPPVLQVTPASNVVASGPQGGPFSPSSFSYTLSATSGSVNFSISGVPNWLTPSATSGTVSSGTTVTFTVNANSLSAGTYGPTTITFTSGSGYGSTTVTATLTVIPVLQVTPTTNMVTAANQGEPFVPSSFQYQLSATAGSINYAISGVPTWLTASATSGTATTTSTTLTFTVNTNANNLAVGTYGPFTITFTNSATGYGTTTVTATLTVNAALATTTTCAKTSKVCPNLWWFNGVSPQPTNYVTTLQAPTGGTDYTWTITEGTQYAQFSNNASNIDTKSKDTVEILPNGDPGDGSPPIVALTVTMKSKKGTVTANPFILNLRKPYELQPNGVVDKTDSTYGYQSQIHYRILDQTGSVLPFPIALNENFTSGVVNDYPGTNWTLPAACGTRHVCTGTYNPSDWYYLVQGAKKGAIPASQHPQTPLGTTMIDHWSGTWGIGSGTPGAGVTAQTNTWQRFQDHARHTNIVSPPP